MKELDSVKLLNDYEGIPAGTTGAIVIDYDRVNCEVEYFDNTGNTIDVLPTPKKMLEVIHVFNDKKPLTPFVKWAGGKTQLLDKLKEKMPKKYKKYYEPFIGGGALFLDIQPKKAVINDVNEQLLNVYIQLKNNANKVIDVIEGLDSVECTKERYLHMRDVYNEKILNNKLDVECAGLTIWINKHCFNGLYRVNSKGLFNVPFNNNSKKTAYDEGNLIGIGEYLSNNNIDIRHGDFEDACRDVNAGDFVYFDSPYIPVSETSNFTDYSKDGFSYEDHKRLSELYRALSKKGAYVMLSNHDVPLVYELYDGFNIESVSVRRNINSDASKRKGLEVIITNYE